MRFFIIKRKIAVYWRKPFVRLATALIVLSAAILLQYYLANRPSVVDVCAPNQRITPATAKSKQEELVIEHPIFDSSRVLFSFKTSSEFINAHFEKAQLFGETLTRFQEKTPPAPAGQETIDFITENVEHVLRKLNERLAASNPDRRRSDSEKMAERPNSQQKGICLTSVTAEVPAGSELPAAIHFYLPEDSDSTRDFYMIVDAKLLIRLDISPSIEEKRINPWIPGCVKHFKVADWDWYLATSSEIEILAAPNSVLHFTYLPTPSSAWKDRNDFLQPFVFGSKPLRAQTVRVNPLSNDKPSTNPSSTKFTATIKKGGPPLDLNHLVLNAEEIQLNFCGKALVRKHGVYVTENFYEGVKKYPIIATFLGMADLALCAWMIRIVKDIFFPREKQHR